MLGKHCIGAGHGLQFVLNVTSILSPANGPKDFVVAYRDHASIRIFPLGKGMGFLTQGPTILIAVLFVDLANHLLFDVGKVVYTRVVEARHLKIIMRIGDVLMPVPLLSWRNAFAY